MPYAGFTAVIAGVGLKVILLLVRIPIWAINVVLDNPRSVEPNTGRNFHIFKVNHVCNSDSVVSNVIDIPFPATRRSWSRLDGSILLTSALNFPRDIGQVDSVWGPFTGVLQATSGCTIFGVQCGKLESMIWVRL
jgi:hypothetical protein